jgi:hypothetical protein
MTLDTLHQELSKLMYIEDKNLVNVVMASIVSNSVQVGDPVWLTIIGPSSGGKSQLIRPLAMAHGQYIHRVDDLTANTLISGTLGVEDSLLGKIGEAGIISMDDLTVLFSKNAEERAAILSQFRMLYDGHYSKSSGNRKEAMVWKGYLGMIAGSTPSIYRIFNEVADMGERFISYRMKPMNVDKAVDFVSEHPTTSKEMNESISSLIQQFLPPLLARAQAIPKPQLHQETLDAIKEAAKHFTLLRTPLHTDDRSGMVDEFPESEMPFRVMKQLNYLAVGMQYMQEDPTAPLAPEFIEALEWTAYSLANDKRRAYMRAVVALDFQRQKITARNVSSVCGLHNDIVTRGLSHLQALNIIELGREEQGRTREYAIKNHALCALVRKLEPMIISEDQIED